MMSPGIGQPPSIEEVRDRESDECEEVCATLVLYLNMQ